MSDQTEYESEQKSVEPIQIATHITVSEDVTVSTITAYIKGPGGATLLTAGTYWLALAFSQSNMYYAHTTASGETRYKNWDAVNNGFTATWGGSDASLSRTISIYAFGTTSYDVRWTGAP